MRSIKIQLTVLLIAFSSIAVGETTTPTAPSLLPKPPSIAANTYILVDYDSGLVLDQKNADLQVEPASLTKMMAMYVVDNEMKAGKLKAEDQITISKNAWQAPGSRMFVQVGTTVSVEDLIKGIIIQSGNDSSIALAEHIAGSEQSFADMMNSYAKTLGMAHSNFLNTTGLPDPNHITTARDMSTLARLKTSPKPIKFIRKKNLYTTVLNNTIAINCYGATLQLMVSRLVLLTALVIA
jgi:D-alanyl-D-alanine carboxypeptidase (penicillin-binding protein 5/6)